MTSFVFAAAGLFVCSPLVQAASSDSFSVTVTVRSPVILHDGTTNHTLYPIVQATDGSGNVNIQFRIKDLSSLPCDVVAGSFEYQVSEGGWQPIADADITGTKTNLASAPDMSGALHTLIWDTSQEYIDDLYSQDVQVRFKVDNGSGESQYGTSPLGVNIDNLDPSGMADFQGHGRRSRIEAYWTPVQTEQSWSGTAHYEIWYGENQADVDARGGTAQEWDLADDPALSTRDTEHTAITGLNPTTNYYLRIWAIDDFGNETALAGQWVTTLGNGSVTISAGENNPADGFAPFGGQNIPMLQLKLVVGAAEYVNLTEISFEADGNGHDVDHVKANGVKLYRDINGDGKRDLSDIQIGTAQVYDSNNGTVTFTGFSETFEYGSFTGGGDGTGTHYILVVYDYAGLEESKEKTFRTRLDQAADAVFSGDESGANIVPAGSFPIYGGLKTLVETGEIDISIDPVTNPAAAEIMNDAEVVPVLQLKLEETTGYESVRIMGITLSASGTGHDADDIDEVRLYFDDNGDGQVDAGDTHIGTTTFSADDGTAYFPMYMVRTVDPGGNRHILVTCNFAGTASAGETFISSLADGVYVELKGMSSQSLIIPESVAGFPLDGNPMTIVAGELEATIGPASPMDSLIEKGTLNEPMIQVRLSETTGLEGVRISSLTLTASGSGHDVNHINQIELYLDGNANGYVDSADTHVGTSAFSGDNGTVTFALNRVVSAGGYLDFLLVYDYNSTPSGGETFQVSIADIADITATGALSSQPIAPDGVYPLEGSVKTISSVPSGHVTIYTGSSNPSSGNIRNDNTNVPMLQFGLLPDSVEDIQFSSVKITHEGSGATADIADVYVYRDENYNGIADGGDVLIGQSNAWVGNELTIVFGVPETITASTTERYLAVYDFNGTAVLDNTFRCTIASNRHLDIVGVDSLVPFGAQGSYPIAGGTMTVADRGTLAVDEGGNNPSAGKVLKDDPAAVMMQVEFQPDVIEDITVNTITLTHSGTGDPATALNTVSLYRDVNDDGLLDAGDVLLDQVSAAGWSANKITLSPNSTITAYTAENWLVVYEFNGTALEAQTFKTSISQSSDITATGDWSGLPVHLSNTFPVSGPQKMIVPVKGHLSVTLGANTPANQSVLNNTLNVNVLQITLEEYTAYEGVRISSMTFTGSGTGHEIADLTRAELYLDVNNDGLVNGSDYLVANYAYYDADDGSVTFVPNRTIAAGTTQNWLLVYDLNGAATTGETFQAHIDPAAVIAKGTTTAIDLTGEGAVIDSNTVTIVKGAISVTAGTMNPGSKSVCSNAQFEPVLQFDISETTGLEPIRLHSIAVTGSGTGHEVEDISKVSFFYDENNNGVYDPTADTHLGDTTFDTDNGKATLTLVMLRYIMPSQTKHILVTYTFNGNADTNESFQCSVADGADIVLTGQTSKESVTATGLPVSGGTVTIALDPSGIVYDSLTGEPINGVSITLRNAADGTPAVGIPEANPQLSGWTGTDGEYQFTSVPGNYYLDVTPVAGYTFPSTVVAQGSLPHPPGYGASDTVGSHGETFTVVAEPLTIHIPLDRDDYTVIKLDKQANKDEVVIGDIVTYTLTIENTLTDDIDTNLYLSDRLPAGFKYISGTTLLEGQPLGDPSGVAVRRFNVGTFTAGQTKTLSYQLVVGSGVEPGNFYTNTARVVSESGTSLSNPAQARVQVVYDPIFDLSIIIGKVFNDINGDGIQQKGEKGIPDVKIATEDGLYVVTDKDGKYHIDGLRPQTKLLKVDSSTLPEGTVFTTENPRVVRLTSGLLAKVNFAVQVSDAGPAAINEKGKPYLEVKVITEPTRIEPQLSISHVPQMPQFTLKGDSLDGPLVFRIDTNYPDFIDSWKLEIFSSHNRVTPLKVFEGRRDTLFKAVSWNGKDDKGEMAIADENYTYLLTVEDGQGHKDTTLENTVYLSSKRTVTREEKLDVLKPAGYSNRLATQTIPVEEKGVTVKIEGLTDKDNRVIIEHRDLGSSEDGMFSKELILPQEKKDITVEVQDRQGVKSVYRKKLNLKKEYFFLVALGDAQLGKMKAKGNIEPVRDKRKYRSGYYFDGRMAYYLKAKVKGKYLITSSFDSERRKKELARFIDPDKYYPVYGDASSVVDDTNTQGRFYILVEWDKSHATWGNYSTDINDVVLAGFKRDLYGGKLAYQSVATTRYGDPQTVFIAFGAETSTLPAHNEFVSTGGVVYYLKHTEVVAGSETVSLEIRDKDTGTVVSSLIMEADVDYEIDYDQGRIIFYKPVSMIADSEKLISEGASLGNPLYVIVDYDYDTQSFVEEGTYGSRFSQQLGDHVKLGATYIKDEKENGYELKGTDLTVKYGKSTELKVEYAESASTSFANYVSYDGGLTFEDLPSEESLSGSAVKIDLKTDLGELFRKKENVLLLEAYYQKVDRGFSSQYASSQQGTSKHGMKLTWNLSAKDAVSLIYDYQRLSSGDNLSAVNQTGADRIQDVTLQYTRSENRYKFTTEYQHHDVKGTPTDEDEEDRDTLAAKVEYTVNEKAKVYVQQQGNIKGKSDNKTIVGTVIEFSKKLKVKLEQLVGNRGTATQLGIDSQVDDKTRAYTTYSFGKEKGEGRTSTTTVGTETNIDRDTRFYTEQEFKSTDTSNSRANILGLDYGHDKWDYKLRLERGRVTNQDETTKRTVISLGADFTEPDIFKYSGLIELRRDNGSEEIDQWTLRNSLEYKASPDWTLFTRLEYSRTHNKTAGKTEAEFKEIVFGAAYRPVDFDRLNLLGKISYIEDDAPLSQSDEADISSERAFVFALEGAYDFNSRYQLVEKFAYKLGEEKVGSRDYTRSQTWLWINRMNYHLTRKWDAGLEYRILDQKQAQDSKTGFLCEVSRHLTDNFQVGVGYNFTDFCDDLTEENDYSTKGFFIRFTGKY